MEFYVNDDREIKTDSHDTPVVYLAFQFPDVGTVSFERKDLDLWEHREPGKRVETIQALSAFDKLVDILEDGYEPFVRHYLEEGDKYKGAFREVGRDVGQIKNVLGMDRDGKNNIELLSGEVKELRSGYEGHAKDLQKNDKEVSGIKARLAHIEDEIRQLKPEDPNRIIKANNSEGLSIRGSIVDIIEFEAPGDKEGETTIHKIEARLVPPRTASRKYYGLTAHVRNLEGKILLEHQWNATPENLLSMLRERADHRYFKIVSYKLTGTMMPRVYPDHKEFETFRSDLLKVR